MDMDQVCGLVNSTGRTPVAALSYATAFHQQQRAGGHGCTSCQCFVNVVNDAQVCGSLNVFRGNGFDDIDDGGDAVKALGRDAIDGTPLPFYQNFTSGTRVDLVCRLATRRENSLRRQWYDDWTTNTNERSLSWADLSRYT
jgi:hypothetical protein